MENAKIVISTAADRDLEAMKDHVNEDVSGKVTKTQLASWIISFFKAAYFTKHVKEIRSDHFDEIAHLEAAVKRMKAARDAGQMVEVGGLLAPVLQRQKTSPPRPTAKRSHADKDAEATK